MLILKSLSAQLIILTEKGIQDCLDSNNLLSEKYVRTRIFNSG